MKFIEVDKKILDFDEYRKNTSLLKLHLKAELKELMKKAGFELAEEGSKQYDVLFIEFYCKEKDLTLAVNLFKQSREKFV